TPARAGTTSGTAVSPAPAPATPPGGDGPPSAEQFRRDLLELVSRRTGYPVDALDETLALEAALGIDSIKTVEIFSNLKAYHEYFRAEGQEEEELLAEFSKFKTLRDIVQYYDRRRQARGAAPAGQGAGRPGTENGSGHEAAGGAAKRYTVAAEPAPLEANGAKKNSLMAAPSS
ncbi:MAG: hypothetical protein J2P46_19130, partial [Zavarzinella sp.]|nr:hypothetical protein [Zavarzinella sp.]